MVLILNIRIQNLFPINSKFIPSLKSLESESLSTIVASSNSISILTFLPEISSTKRIFFWGDFGAAGVCSSTYQNKEQIWWAISSIFSETELCILLGIHNAIIEWMWINLYMIQGLGLLLHIFFKKGQNHTQPEY